MYQNWMIHILVDGDLVQVIMHFDQNLPQLNFDPSTPQLNRNDIDDDNDGDNDLMLMMTMARKER